jgi:hypothetical protein
MSRRSPSQPLLHCLARELRTIVTSQISRPVPTEKSIPTDLKKSDWNVNQDDENQPEKMATQNDITRPSAMHAGRCPLSAAVKRSLKDKTHLGRAFLCVGASCFIGRVSRDEDWPRRESPRLTLPVVSASDTCVRTGKTHATDITRPPIPMPP